MNLFNHQIKIVDAGRKIRGLWLGTGTGKTLTALLLAKGKTLVIAPKTQFEDRNWERQLEEAKIRLPLTVISKETFRRDWETLPAYDTLIIDEAHTCLGVTPNTRSRKRVITPKASQLFEALDAYIQKTKPKRIYPCTATIMRSPMTVWAALVLLKPIAPADRMADFYAFREKFYTRLPIPFREVWVPKTDNESKTLLAKLARSVGDVGRLEDFFDVPEQTFKTVSVELTTEQKTRIKEMKLEYPEPIVRIGKIHQIENGSLASDGFSSLEEFDNRKIEKILDLAIEFPRMVIFVKYTAQIHQIDKALRKAKYRTFLLTGATKDRGKVIADANKSNGIFIAQAQISAGWELPEYPVMVFASMTYSLVDRVQAEGRILRANHIKKNLYIDLVARGGVDEAVYKAIHNKKDFDAVLYAKQI